MTWTYNQYVGANMGISFGLALLSLVFMLALLLCRTDTFYLFIKLLFNIEHEEVNAEEEHSTAEAILCCCCTSEPRDGTKKIQQKKCAKDIVLNLYEEDTFRVPMNNTCALHKLVCCQGKCSFKYFPHCDACFLKTALVVMATAVFTAVFVVFFDGLILIVSSVDQNGNCPILGMMDCYSNSLPHTYFSCNSSNTLIDASLGRVTCYRWFSQDITTHDVIDQVGLCGGLMAAFGVFVIIFLRFNVYILKRKSDDKSDSEDSPTPFTLDDCCCCGLDKVVRRYIRNRKYCCSCLQVFKRPELVVVWVLVLIMTVGGFITAMVLLYPVSVTGMTYAILAAALGVTAVAFPVFLVKRSPKDLEDTKLRKDNKALIEQFIDYIKKMQAHSSSPIVVLQAANGLSDYGQKQNSERNMSSNRTTAVLAAHNSKRYLPTQRQE
jgi:hypothetical protein